MILKRQLVSFLSSSSDLAFWNQGEKRDRTEKLESEKQNQTLLVPNETVLPNLFGKNEKLLAHLKVHTVSYQAGLIQA